MGIVIDSNGVIDIAASTPGTYRITYTTAGACPNSSTQDITINALPTVAISGTLSYCAGSTTTLTATAGLSSYLWSTGATTQSINITAGSYTVTGTDSNGCSNTSAQVTVTELALPTVAISGTLSYCAGPGSNTTLTATAGLSSYLWSSGETTQSITAIAGTYTVTGTDSNGCSNTSSSVTVTETPLDDSSFSYASNTYRQDESDPTPTITGLTGGTFSGTTGLVINSTTGEIDLSASTVATHTITYDTTSSGSSVCPNTSTQTVEIAVAGIANNYSMNFDPASSDYISFPDISLTGEFTVSFWMNADAFNGVIIGDSANANWLRIDSTTQTDLKINNQTKVEWESGATFTTGGWQNVVLRRDSSNVCTIFRNGTHYTSNSPTMTGTFGPLNRIGQKAGINYFNGKMDEVAIWDTALTSTQIAEIYNATSTNLTKDLTTVSGSNLKYWNRMGD